MSTFKYTDEELKVLKNFASVSSNMIIMPDRFAVINGLKQSIVGYYNFKEKKNHDTYGIFDLTDFINQISTFSDYELEVKNKYIAILDKLNKGELKYNLTALDMLPEVGDLGQAFNNLEVSLKLTLTTEQLNTVKKVIQSTSAEKLFFGNINKKLRMITAGKSIEKSTNPYEIILDSHVDENNLGEDLIFINKDEFKILEGDYEVDIRLKERKGISRWYNKLFDVEYFIGVSRQVD